MGCCDPPGEDGGVCHLIGTRFRRQGGSARESTGKQVSDSSADVVGNLGVGAVIIVEGLDGVPGRHIGRNGAGRHVGDVTCVLTSRKCCRRSLFMRSAIGAVQRCWDNPVRRYRVLHGSAPLSTRSLCPSTHMRSSRKSPSCLQGRRDPTWSEIARCDHPHDSRTSPRSPLKEAPMCHFSNPGIAVEPPTGANVAD